MAREDMGGIRSLLDTDLYKLTMQAAVLQHYSDVDVSYRFFNRAPERSLSQNAFEWLRTQVTRLGELQVTEDELGFLRSTCPYLPDTYLTYLRDLRLQPSRDVALHYEPSTRALSIDIAGKWKDTILYEIPLLSLVSEAYFLHDDVAWTHDGQLERAARKAEQLCEAGCVFSEFGSRRRRDYRTHDLVMQGLLEGVSRASSRGAKGTLAGTSNVHMAHKYKVKPIGTVAHEWFMGTAAVTADYDHANSTALQRWRQTYGDELGIALTDTFGTSAFLRDFTPELARAYAGVRQDSGSPEKFCGVMASWYRDHGIDPRDKTIVFSDSLDVDRARHLQAVAEKEGIKASFGIGTFLTNDFDKVGTPAQTTKSPAMNIVIKLASAAGKPAIKISDELHKNTGDPEMVAFVKRQLGYDDTA
ncbi:nicotinate phosphoribosyltransferase [Savitreella phatthalungensis]